MRLGKRIFKDYLWWQTYRTKNPKILDVIKQMLPAGDPDNLEPHISVIAQEKLIIVTKDPERLREIILIRIGKRGPESIYRSRLSLKGKQSAGEV